jgi:hypothetical protein
MSERELQSLPGAMSPAASSLLVNVILPVLARTVPRTVHPAPGEDVAELVQDGIAIAANMLQADERAGREPIAISIAYYSIQRLKCGRRSYSSSITDVLSPHAQRVQGLSVVSMQEPVNVGSDEGGEELCFGDLLACRRDDPVTEVCRRLDWHEFLETQDDREKTILHDLAHGNSLQKTAAKLNVSAPRITQLKDRIGRKIKARMGDGILADVSEQPLWRKARQQ